MVSIKASEQGLKIIDEARKRQGWDATSAAWYEKAATFLPPNPLKNKAEVRTISISTLKRFREGKAIRRESFIAFCKAVGINNWETICDDFKGEDEKVTLQDAFLDELLNQMYSVSKGSYIHQVCFWLRFHPQNWQSDNDELLNKINEDEEVKEKFQLAQFEQVLSEITEKFKKTFESELIISQVGISISSLDKLVQVLYKWTWKSKFPKEAWRISKKIGINISEEMLMKPYNNKRDIDFEINDKVDLYQDIKLNKEYLININLRQNGYLLVINEGVSGNKYCLCPSKLYTNDQQISVKTEKISVKPEIQIPTKKALLKSLKFNQVGDENFIVFITKDRLHLSWIHSDYISANEIDYIKIDNDRLQEIFRELGKQIETQVFYRKFRVNV